MSDQLLGALKICLLVLLYLFFARVLWAVWSEVRLGKMQATDSRSATRVPSKATKAMSRDAVAHAGPTMADTTADDREGTTEATRPVYSPNRDPREKRPLKPKRGEVSKLVIIEPRSMKGVGYPIGDELTIGRAEGCTISLVQDTYLSQLHARIYRNAGRVEVEDLGSTNGSFLNGNRLHSSQPLTRGDRLQIGGTVLELE